MFGISKNNRGVKLELTDDQRHLLLVKLLEILSEKSDNRMTDEPTFRKYIYCYNKMLKNNHSFKPIYGEFVNSHYGPYNEELYKDIEKLIKQQCILFKNYMLKPSEKKINISIKKRGPVNELVKYLKSKPCDLKIQLPLNGISNAKVSTNIP